MTQNVIVAQRVFCESKNVNVWQVAVKVPSGKMFARRNCQEAIKAMRYMFLLKARHGFEIAKECMEMLKEEHRQAKAALEVAQSEEQSGVLPTVAPLFDIDQVRLVLNEAEVGYDDIYMEDFRLCVSIYWGDWKHDHLCCRHVMQSLGYHLIEERVTDEDGSDAYSAVHYYDK